MHEMALAEGILAVALDAAEGQRVHRVRVRVGELQRVVPDVLNFSFELLIPGTLAEGAVLELEDEPARVRCRYCGAQTQIRDAALACASCGAIEIEVVAGADILVEGVLLDDGWRLRPTPEDAPAITVPPEHLAWHALHDTDESDHAAPDHGRGGHEHGGHEHGEYEHTGHSEPHQRTPAAAAR